MIDRYKGDWSWTQPRWSAVEMESLALSLREDFKPTVLVFESQSSRFKWAQLVFEAVKNVIFSGADGCVEACNDGAKASYQGS